MPSRYSSGCIFQNGSTSNWHSWAICHDSWHILFYTVWHRSTWINSFWYQTCQLVAVCGRHLHFNYSSRRYRLSTIGRRSFPVSASIFWNTLPPDVQSSPSVSIFCQRLKSYLFHQVLSWCYYLTFYYANVDFEMASCYSSHSKKS